MLQEKLWPKTDFGKFDESLGFQYVCRELTFAATGVCDRPVLLLLWIPKRFARVLISPIALRDLYASKNFA
jgi:hypothetical protein